MKSPIALCLLFVAFACGECNCNAAEQDAAVSNHRVSEFQWLKLFAEHMKSLEFSRADAEAALKPHAAQLAMLDFQTDHPAITACAHFLRVHARLVPAAQPPIARLEKVFGAANAMPRMPDSGELNYIFYPNGIDHDVTVRVIATVDARTDRIAALSIDREKICANEEKKNGGGAL